jgi:hypothetical protein
MHDNHVHEYAINKYILHKVQISDIYARWILTLSNK